MENNVPVDPEKVQKMIAYLNAYILELPEYNQLRKLAQTKLMDLYDIQSKTAITAEERDDYNQLLRDAEAPQDLFF